MDQYLLIPFLEGWTSIYQLFWCSPGVQGFDPLPYPNLWGFMPHLTSESKAGPISLLAAPPDQPNFRVKNTYKTNVWLRTYKCKYIASYKNICIYICIIYIYVYMYIYIYMCMCIHIYIYMATTPRTYLRSHPIAMPTHQQHFQCQLKSRNKTNKKHKHFGNNKNTLENIAENFGTSKNII